MIVQTTKSQATTDSLGRRRRATQLSGLRPLYPVLPLGVVSKSLRVAMTQAAWARLDDAVDHDPTKTRPRAVGEILERALAPAPDWQDWQIRKEKQLLRPAS